MRHERRPLDRYRKIPLPRAVQALGSRPPVLVAIADRIARIRIMASLLAKGVRVLVAHGVGHSAALLACADVLITDDAMLAALEARHPRALGTLDTLVLSPRVLDDGYGRARVIQRSRDVDALVATAQAIAT